MKRTAEQALEIFRQLLPLVNVTVYDKEMRYKMRNVYLAEWYQDYALRLIIDNQLPLTVDVAKWERGGKVFDVQLVVEYAPEMESITA